MMACCARVFLFALCLALPAGAMADTTLIYSSDQGDSGDTNKMFIHDDAIRSSGHGNIYMIYRADEDILYVVNSQKKSYAALDQERIREMGQRLQAIRNKMRQKMKKMPEKQRGRMEKSLSPLLDKPEKATYSPTGNTDEVAGYSCREGVVKRGGKVAVRLCVADPDDLDMSNGDYETLSGLFRFMGKMSNAIHSKDTMPDFSSIHGVPVRWDSVGDGQTSILQSVSHADIPAEKFEVPAGYTERKPPSPPE